MTPVATTAERVDQKVVFVPTGSKQQLLATILRDESIDRVLVFTRTKHGADRVVRGLERDGIGSAAIHGNKSQPQRERALAAFRAGTCRVLVATDIAARGIDVDGVSHVVNFDLPNVPEAYVHRIGRTARAGKDGLAISFCNDEEKAYLRDIERLTRQKVPVMAIPEGFVPPSREEAAQAVAEAERDRRQPGSGPRGQRPGGGRQGQQPGGRQGQPAGRQGQPRHGAGRPQEHREPRAHDGRGGQEGRSARPQGQGQGRPQGQGQGRPQGASAPTATASSARRAAGPTVTAARSAGSTAPRADRPDLR